MVDNTQPHWTVTDSSGVNLSFHLPQISHLLCSTLMLLRCTVADVLCDNLRQLPCIFSAALNVHWRIRLSGNKTQTKKTQQTLFSRSPAVMSNIFFLLWITMTCGGGKKNNTFNDDPKNLLPKHMNKATAVAGETLWRRRLKGYRSGMEIQPECSFVISDLTWGLAATRVKGLECPHAAY